jgi:hypothetical protein
MKQKIISKTGLNKAVNLTQYIFMLPQQQLINGKQVEARGASSLLFSDGIGRNIEETEIDL